MLNMNPIIHSLDLSPLLSSCQLQSHISFLELLFLSPNHCQVGKLKLFLAGAKIVNREAAVF